MVTPGWGTTSVVIGLAAPAIPTGSGLKSLIRSVGVTLLNSGVRALYICACWSAFAGGGTDPYSPEGTMSRPMIA